jgi:hypothetical protein
MENNGKPTDQSNGVVVVRPAAEIMSRQQLPYYVGISEITAGAKNISMNLIIIPPPVLLSRTCTRDMKPLSTCSKAGWTRVTASSWRIRLSVKREISFISKPTCRTNPSMLALPNPHWLSSHAMMPTSKNMLSPIADNITNQKSERSPISRAVCSVGIDPGLVRKECCVFYQE